MEGRYDKRLKSHHDSMVLIKSMAQGRNNISEYIKNIAVNKKPGAIYIHVPFCSKICNFCSMQRTLSRPADDYADMVIEQIKYYSSFKYIQDSKYNCVYFGGGTPTTLGTENLRRILMALKEYMPLTEEVEITSETTITELTDEKIDMFMDEGVNRLSIGVQTFSDKGRKVLGRRGNADKVYNKLEYLNKKKFPNINIDVIYNYEGETINDLNNDIESILRLNLSGFSFYSLIINDNSNMGQSIFDKERFYKESFLRDKEFFYLIANRFLEKGFEFLELTKMVRPAGDKYQYIKTRYGGGDTLPIGAGAGGMLGNSLLHNSFDLNEFRRNIANIKDNPFFGIEVNAQYKIINYLIGCLQFGKINIDDFKGQPFYNKLTELLNEISKNGLIEIEDNIYKLNKDGFFWGNNISNEVINNLFIKNI